MTSPSRSHTDTPLLSDRLAAAERIGLRRPWEIIYDREANGAISVGSVRIVDADRRLIARFREDEREYEALTFEAMQLIVDAVNAAHREEKLEVALRDILEGVGAFTPDGWLANTDEVVRARAVLEDKVRERQDQAAATPPSPSRSHTDRNLVVCERDMEAVLLRGDGDMEAVHAEADAILCRALKLLGYRRLVRLYDDVPKWYA